MRVAGCGLERWARGGLPALTDSLLKARHGDEVAPAVRSFRFSNSVSFSQMKFHLPVIKPQKFSNSCHLLRCASESCCRCKHLLQPGSGDPGLVKLLGIFSTRLGCALGSRPDERGERDC